MSVGQCRAVQAIVDHGSFAAAAKSLSMTPSAVSMQISNFEASLGVLLFDRSSRPPRLTDAGRTVAVHARKIVSEYDAMHDALSLDFSRGAAIRIGVIPTVVTNLLPAAVMILKEHRSAPRLTVTTALSGDLFWAVDRGELDAALIHQPENLREGYVWKEVSSQQVVVIAPPDSTEIELRPLFEAHPYIRFNRQAWVGPLIEKRLRQLGITVSEVAEIQSIDAIRLLVSRGYGASIIPLVGDAGDSPRVRTIGFGTPPLHRSIGFYMRRSLSARLLARAMVEAFQEASKLG